MTSIFLRVIIAIVAFLFFMALMPPVLAVLGLNLDGNVLRIIQLCAAGIALFYIVRGPGPWKVGP